MATNLAEIKKKIPLVNVPDIPLVGATQDLVPIADIVDDIVMFNDGGAALVMESTSLNFGLLSDREQEAVIAAFAALINSLSFAIQIVVRTQRKDISQYLIFLENSMEKIQNTKLESLMKSYKNFIEETIKKKNVLGKRFFVVVPFSPFELGATQSFKTVMLKRAGPIPYSKDYVLRRAKTALYPKRDHLIRQGARLGLILHQLNVPELTDLYFSAYNPKKEAVRERYESKVEERKEVQK